MLEMVDPKEHNQKKIPFCTSLFKFFLKYDRQTCHWYGHSKTNQIDVNKFSKRKKPN